MARPAPTPRGVLDREVSERDRLGVDETETLKRLFYDRLRSGAGVSRRVVPRESVAELWSEVGHLAEALPDRECVLLHQHDEYTGAVRVPGAAVLRSAARVWVRSGRICGSRRTTQSMASASSSIMCTLRTSTSSARGVGSPPDNECHGR